MKPHVCKETVKDDHSIVINCAVVDQKVSKDTKMDASSDCAFICSTPHLSRRDDACATLSTQSIFSVDSGFSDETFDSMWMSCQSAQSCPDLEDERSRRLTLQASDFSPINRRSSTSIQGRRLEFSTLYLQPSPHQENDESSSVAAVGGQDVSSLNQARSVLLTNSSAIVSSNSGSQNDVVTSDLEASLQEMALEESPSFSSRISPLPFAIANCDRIRLDYHDAEKYTSQLCASNKDIKTPLQLGQCYGHTLGFVESQTEQIDTHNFSSSSTSSLEHTGSIDKLETAHINNLDTETIYQGADSKVTFFNQPFLTPTGPEQSYKLTFASVLKKNLSTINEHTYAAHKEFKDSVNILESDNQHKEFKDSVNILESDNQPVFSDSRVPPLPYMYTTPASMTDQFKSFKSAVQYQTDDCNNLVLNSQVYNPPVRGPSKRSCECEEDCGLLFSPTKIIKTEYISERNPCKEHKSVISSPKKNASRRILNEKGESSALRNGATSLVCEHVFSSRPFSLSTPVETKTICGENLVDRVCDEKMTKSTDHRLSSDQLPELMTPKDTVKLVGTAKDKLQRILEKFSPPQPSHLIGRHVGVNKFDILQELHCQNFHFCLGKILQYVANTDLVSVSKVNQVWKSAMYSDLKAYTRYRQHMRSLPSNRVQRGSGKENSGEKPLDARTVQPLTQPRGLLTSIQSQAKRKVIPAPPPTITVKDTLLCDDTLRICPRCQGPALIKHCQDRATCTNDKCLYDFCTLCFSSYHYPWQCKPLCRAPSKADVAGTRKSKKNLKRL